MSMRHNLQRHAKRILAYSNRPRFFCSYTNGTLSSPARNQTLQSRIEAASHQKAEITTVLEQWLQLQQQQGKQLNPSLLRGIVEKLRSSNRPRQALEVSDWMVEQKIYNLPEDFSARFHLTEKVLNLEEAEKFFESIPENMRFESMYNSLLRSYARQSGEKALKKAESIFKKMKKLGLLLRPSPYNSMTSLYSSLGNRDKVDEILREMKENNVELDNVTVNNALRVYAAVSDVATMDKFLADRKEITRLDGLTMLAMAKAYELMSLYGEAGEIEDVYRVWDKYKATREKDNEGFRTLIGSLLKLGDTKGAEKIYYNEWECSGLEFDNRIPDMLVSGYREKGMVMKADKLVNKTLWIRGLATPITLLLEEMDKKGNKVFNLFSEDYATRLHLTEKVLGLEEAENFFESSIPENMKDYSVYDTLLSCYARSSNTQSKAEAVFEKMRELGLLNFPHSTR
ncbi:Pentatricopeptide repeat [Arabidopsis suecica]|uniref:Pentatricopeptide repeat n=1 Tax=Arabidopsis suecica TaxID=45249 RepID=A0A8T2F3R6_ARASU|nr:Pentatricopeptide repeat [Arabidopsis suecica]